MLGALAAQMYFLSGLTFISALAAWLILRQRGGLSYLLLIVAPLIGVVQVVGLTSSILGVALQISERKRVERLFIHSNRIGRINVELKLPASVQPEKAPSDTWSW